jgi:hypothetical protein
VDTILEISARRTIFILAVIALTLSVLGAMTLYMGLQASTGGFDPEALTGVQRLVNIAGEANIPTWFKAATLLLCAQLLFLISVSQARNDAPYSRHWRDLGILFLFLSMDEIATIHEEVGAEITAFLQTTGIFLYGWVIIGIVFVTAFVMVYAGFVRSLPRMPRYLFVLAGTIYVGGALGLKMVEGWYVDNYGEANIGIILLITVKQFMQMSGVIVFLYALLGYARHNVEDPLVRIVQ